MRNKISTTAAVVLFAFAAQPVMVMAQHLETAAKTAQPQYAVQDFEQQVFDTSPNPSLQLAELSDQEMKETEGAVAPLVAVGVMTAGRFIVQRMVTQSVAKSMVRSAGSNAFRQSNTWGVMARSRSQAKAILGNKPGVKPIREFHAGSGQRFTHYHTNPRNGAHVWYGKPR